jgi:zinc transport system substrate-binding protein
MRSWTALATIALLAACAQPAPEESAVDTVPGETTIGTVEVTNYPLQFVVERLAAPLLTVSFRAGGAPDPAYWRPTAEDVIAMQAADLIVVNGASYESWMQDVSLPTSRLIDTTAGAGARLIAITATTTHSHGLEGEHEHTGTAFTTWLDPTLLAEQARSVHAALGARWPEHAGHFDERLAALEADLEALDTAFEGSLANVGERRVIFSHPVYQYLQQRYGLAGDSLHWEPDEAPDEAAWAELEHLLGHGGAAVMVWEGEPLEETAQRLDERGIKSIVVDPCATVPTDGDLLDVMRANADRIDSAFGQS